MRVAIAAAVTAVTAPGAAAEIRWTGDPSCRRELEVAEQVASMTGRELRAIDSADFELDTQPPSAGTWQLELKTTRRADNARSSRTLQGKSCVEVTDAAAVAIALAVGPESEPSEPHVHSEQPASAIARASAIASVSRAPAVRRPTSLLWFAALAGTLDSSVTPNVALGGALHLGLGWQPSRVSLTRLRFDLEGALYAPIDSAPSDGRGGRFQLGYVAPLVCGETPLGGNALLGCVGYELGQLSGEGRGKAVSAPHRATTFWSAARAELGLFVPLVAQVRVFGRAGVALPLVRHEFVLDGSDLVYRPAALSFRGQLGLELSL